MRKVLFIFLLILTSFAQAAEPKPELVRKFRNMLDNIALYIYPNVEAKNDAYVKAIGDLMKKDKTHKILILWPKHLSPEEAQALLKALNRK